MNTILDSINKISDSCGSLAGIDCKVPRTLYEHKLFSEGTLNALFCTHHFIRPMSLDDRCINCKNTLQTILRIEDEITGINKSKITKTRR